MTTKLSLEREAGYRIFCQQVEQASREQAIDLLKYLYLEYLNYQTLTAEMVGQQMGLL